MSVEAALAERLGLRDRDLRINLSKEELFHEAIANDRGRVRRDGPDDEQKAFSTKLGVNGPLVYYTDPTCTGRPVSLARRAASVTCRWLVFPPNPPPTKGVITRTFSAGICSASAACRWSQEGACVEAQTVARSPCG